VFVGGCTGAGVQDEQAGEVEIGAWEELVKRVGEKQAEEKVYRHTPIRHTAHIHYRKRFKLIECRTCIYMYVYISIYIYIRRHEIPGFRM